MGIIVLKVWKEMTVTQCEVKELRTTKRKLIIRMGTKTGKQWRMMMSLLYICAILAKSRSFSLLQNISTSSGTNPTLHSISNEGSFLPIAHKQSATLSSQSMLSYSSHALLTFPSSSVPLHNISSSVPSNALDVRHFLKPFIVTSGEMCCHSPLIHTD